MLYHCCAIQFWDRAQKKSSVVSQQKCTLISEGSGTRNLVFGFCKYDEMGKLKKSFLQFFYQIFGIFIWWSQIETCWILKVLQKLKGLYMPNIWQKCFKNPSFGIFRVPKSLSKLPDQSLSFMVLQGGIDGLRFICL